LTDAEPAKQSIGCTDIFLLKRGEAIYALANKCSHLGGPLSEGKMVGNSIQCPWHGSRFCVKDGSVVDGPATHPLPVLDVQLREGQVYVRAQRT